MKIVESNHKQKGKKMLLDKKLYSIDEVTKLLGVSRPKLTELCNDRKIHYYRIGRRIKFSPEQLDDYLQRQIDA